MLTHYIKIKIKPIQQIFAVSKVPCLSELEPVVNVRYTYTASGLRVVVSECFLIFLSFFLFSVLSNLNYANVS